MSVVVVGGLDGFEVGELEHWAKPDHRKWKRNLNHARNRSTNRLCGRGAQNSVGLMRSGVQNLAHTGAPSGTEVIDGTEDAKRSRGSSLVPATGQSDRRGNNWNLKRQSKGAHQRDLRVDSSMIGSLW